MNFEECLNHEDDWNYYISDDYDTEYNIDGSMLRTKDGSVVQYTGPSPECLYQKIHPTYIKVKNVFDAYFWFFSLYQDIFNIDQKCVIVDGKEIFMVGHEFMKYILYNEENYEK